MFQVSGHYNSYLCRYAVVQVYAVFWADLSTDEVYEAPIGNKTVIQFELSGSTQFKLYNC